jgi:hypothetical protein
LDPATLLSLAEQDRPASAELAAALGLSLSTKRLLRRMKRVGGSAPVVLGDPLSSRRVEQLTRRSALTRARPTPATLQFIVPWRWSRPEADPAYRTLWQDIRVALGCVTLLLLPGILALIILLLTALSDLLGAYFKR